MENVKFASGIFGVFDTILLLKRVVLAIMSKFAKHNRFFLTNGQKHITLIGYYYKEKYYLDPFRQYFFGQWERWSDPRHTLL